jgi:hypothetical protein
MKAKNALHPDDPTTVMAADPVYEYLKKKEESGGAEWKGITKLYD